MFLCSHGCIVSIEFLKLNEKNCNKTKAVGL